METQHADLIPLYPPYLGIGIDKNGFARIDGHVIDDYEKLPILIEENSEVLNIKYTKIQLFIDRDVVFGPVLEVFRVLKKAGYDKIVLSSSESVSTADLMKEKKEVFFRMSAE
jgi:biopolymer transport protein ExbD